MTTTPTKRITSLQRDLHDAGYDCRSINQRVIWAACIDLRIPAHQERGIWHFSPLNIPEIAAGLKLPKLDEAPTPHRRGADLEAA